jgi:small subunit ribosomal protein S1
LTIFPRTFYNLALRHNNNISLVVSKLMDRINSNPSRKLFPNSPDDPNAADQAPPPPDEGYWSALLREGETGTSSSQPEVMADWDDFESSALASSPPGAQDEGDWQGIQEIFAGDRTLELPVIGYNRGGLLVEWKTLRGFVPASQLVSFSTVPDPVSRRGELAVRIGQKLLLRIIELDRTQNRLILSERAAQVQPGTRATVLDQLKKGDICTGQVTNLCDFGAFVDLGGLEGLIHISELSWGRVGHPADMLKRGQDVRVFVMEVHREQGRVALSVKRLQPDPWETVEQRYHIGQMIEGVITNVVDFGAFACVEEGLEGLIHVSELAEGHFLHPRNVVSEGQTVRARVLNIDGRARRLGLSLRAETVSETPKPEALP